MKGMKREEEKGKRRRVPCSEAERTGLEERLTACKHTSKSPRKTSA